MCIYYDVKTCSRHIFDKVFYSGKFRASSIHKIVLLYADFFATI